LSGYWIVSFHVDWLPSDQLAQRVRPLHYFLTY
jgi:hypothetical protein